MTVPNEISHTNVETTDVDILIVGFGFSVLPLIRELDRSGRCYTIICKKNSAWDRLCLADRLDFDLVSSHYTSFYSFDLVEDHREDRFPTAKEFHALQCRYYDAYQEKIIDDYVEVVHNFDDYSVVRTSSGRTYKASNLIIAPAFKRRMTDDLCKFDFRVSGKTIVFNSVGDSANLMISKLVPGNNKVICLHNGFVPVDKIMSLNGVTFTLDQLEFHNFGFHFRRTYRNLVGGGFCSMNIIKNALAKALQVTFLSPVFCRHNFQTVFGIAREHEVDQLPTTPLPNGVVTMKYWPIDKYADEFSERLEEAIADGYLLNDIAFFANEGLVELWPRNTTEIDREARTVSCNGEQTAYDCFVEADREMPNLPQIIVADDESAYEYRYRDNYYGVVPAKLSNVYFLGLTRPTTGGLANITEMQSLLVHKLLTNDDFLQETRSILTAKIEEYNRSHYLQKAAGRTDHVVWYGTYTEELARLIGINIRLRDCRSLKELNQYFFLPNNAFKYRQVGEYRVDGCEALVEHVYQEHQKYRIIHYYLLSFTLYRILFFEYSVLLYAENLISITALIGLLVFQLIFAKLAVIPTQNYFGLFKVTYLSMGVVALAVFGSGVFLPFLLVDFGYTYFIRQRGFRHMFNDLKNKSKYRGFFKRYLKAYSAVRTGDGTF